MPKSQKFSCIKNIQNMKIINSKVFKSTKSCITEKSHVLLQNFSWINIVWKERWNITMARTNYTHFEKTHLKLPLQIFIFFQKNCIFLKQKKGLVQTCLMYYRTQQKHLTKKINITISIVNIFYHTVTSVQFIKNKINIPFCFCFCLWSVKPVKI